MRRAVISGTELAVGLVVHGNDLAAVDEPEILGHAGELRGQLGLGEVDDPDKLPGLGVEGVSPLAGVPLVVGDRVVDDPYPPPGSALLGPCAQGVQPGLFTFRGGRLGPVEVAALVRSVGGHLVSRQRLPPEQVTDSGVEHLPELRQIEQCHAGTSCLVGPVGMLRWISTAASPTGTKRLTPVRCSSELVLYVV